MAYIDREKARELIINFGKGAIEDGMKTLDPVDDIILLSSGVDLIPAADVVEVRHGENITKMYPTDEFICSECGLIMRDFEEIRVDEENDECHYEFEFKYCPNCGAKMDGKDGE